MTLEQLQKEMIQAMKNKDTVTRDVLRSVISAVKKTAIDERCDTTEELIDRVLLKEKKTLQEQIDTCPADRTDYLQDYRNKMDVLENYVPKLLDNPKEIRDIVVRELAAALGKERVIGVKMPCGEQHDIADADKVIEMLGIDDYQINIGSMVDAVHNELRRADINSENKWVKTNIPPRIRMTVLYAVAAANGGLVANTSNLSERTVGWSTKWGDGVGDFAPLADYTVEEIMGIGEVLGIPDELLYKEPEDGLTGKSDEENLGVTYEQIDEYIRTNENPQPYEAYRKIVNLQKNGNHKWHMLPQPRARVRWNDRQAEDFYF